MTTFPDSRQILASWLLTAAQLEDWQMLCAPDVAQKSLAWLDMDYAKCFVARGGTNARTHLTSGS